MNEIGIYVHIPFCAKKCPYCDFYSVIYNENIAREYTDNMCRIIENTSNTVLRKADTLYFGGGTPSIIGAEHLGKITDTVKKYFLTDNPEITVEVNPSKSDIDFQKLRAFGVNRISVGLQSSDDKELQLLGRLHDSRQAHRCIQLARSSGFDNISLDLMIATPNQTLESLERSIAFCAELNVQHISAYILKIEKGTPYYNMRDTLNLCDDDKQAEMYLFACNKLKEYGFYQYEISNFCKKGFESRHNLKYWHDEEYIGFGASAHSFINGKRFFFQRSFQDFYNLRTVDDGEGGSVEEFVMLGLRLSEGITNSRFKQRFKTDIPPQYIRNAQKFEKVGYTVADQNGIRLTENGFLLSNAIIAEILSD